MKSKKEGRTSAPALRAALVKAGTERKAASPSKAPIFQRTWFLAAALVVVTAAIYSPVLRNSFVNFDDEAYILENDPVKAGLTFSTIRWALTAMEQANWHPLTWISHALDVELFGLNPAGHHGTNLAIHAVNAALVFLLLLTATGARWSSLVVAGLFALHPLNVESVAWAAERKNVLSMLFFLLTLAAYGWYARKPAITRYLPMAVIFALALAAKPMVVTLPCALLLLDYWPLRRARSTGEHGDALQHSWGWLFLEKVPLFAMSAASSVVTLFAQRESMASSEALPLIQRLSNATNAYVAYLWKAFWPTRLAAFYPHEGARLPGWQIGLCLVFLLAITGTVWWQRRFRPYLLIGWLWYLGNLVPVIGIVQVGDQGMADRYVYLPVIGIFVMLAWGISDLTATKVGQRRVRPLAAVAVLAMLLLSFLTVRQIGTWRSSNDLWSHALQVTCGNYVAEDYIGSALLVQSYEATGQRYSDEATKHFRNAIRINPHDAIGNLNVGADDHEHGRLREAIEHYSETLRSTNDTHLLAKAYIALGAAYGQLHAFDQAQQAYRMATKFEPDNRGLFMRMGQLALEEKIARLADNVAAHPNAEDYVVLGQLQQSVGRPVEARKSFEQALKLDPKSGEARNALATVAQ